MIPILILGALVHFFFGSLAYVRETLRGTSQPNRMTFLIWAIGPFIGVAAGLEKGAGWALLPVFMAGLGPSCVFLASFVNPKAYWKLGVLDYICGALALGALGALFVAKEQNIAIALAIVADTLALLPTLIKAWRFPKSETGQTYIVALGNVCLGLLFSQRHSFSDIGFLIYIVIANILLICALYRKRLFQFS